MRRDEIRRLFHSLYPGATLIGVSRFGVDDADGGGTTEKGIGYGQPVRVRGDKDGSPIDLVVHTATPDAFGHDRRSDRAAEVLLAFDTFPLIPKQAPAVDVGVVTEQDRFRSLRDGGEFYLITEYRPGSVYADDLRRIADRGTTEDRDHRRTRQLADYLAELHREPTGTGVQYRRAIRDLVGSGEGIFGIGDGYPDDSPPAMLEQVHRLETACVPWRWKLRDARRSRRIHGDFHPFNLLFTENDELSVLDAARGCVGDPADDVTCLAINYVFFALANGASWAGGFRSLWRELWERYLELSGDSRVLDAAPPFFAWRILVLANPRWYPGVDDERRAQLLDLAEKALAGGRLELDLPEELF